MFSPAFSPAEAVRGNCRPAVRFAFEDFQSGSTAGWTNGKLGTDPGFGNFLGRYGLEDGNNFPSKTFTVPADARYVKLQFDFLEIDSWDSDQGDYLAVVVGSQTVNLGTFYHYTNEDGRAGGVNGISFVIRSKAPPGHIGFNSSYMDQIHQVTLEIPSIYVGANDQLTIAFHFSLNEPTSNESAGFDNIELIAKYGSQIFSLETFEDGLTTGWTNGKTETGSGMTTFLGRYGLEDGTKYPSRTYTVPAGAKEVVFKFDFLEIDSWDAFEGDTLSVVLNGVHEVDLGLFDVHQTEGGRFGTQNNVDYSLQTIASPGNLDFHSFWWEQIHRVVLFVPDEYFAANGKLTVEFRMTMSEPRSNESAGFDNIMVKAVYDTKLLSFENFETGQAVGWTNAKINSDVPALTTFLGRYGKEDGANFPRKTFTVPQDAKEAILQFHFYEIDSWDASHGDSLSIVLDGNLVDLGNFDTHSTSTKQGIFGSGLVYRTFSLGPPTNLGFSTEYNDERHLVDVTIPSSYFAADGLLEVELRATLSEGIENESAGFDNIRLSVNYDCG